MSREAIVRWAASWTRIVRTFIVLDGSDEDGGAMLRAPVPNAQRELAWHAIAQDCVRRLDDFRPRPLPSRPASLPFEEDLLDLLRTSDRKRSPDDDRKLRLWRDWRDRALEVEAANGSTLLHLLRCAFVLARLGIEEGLIEACTHLNSEWGMGPDDFARLRRFSDCDRLALRLSHDWRALPYVFRYGRPQPSRPAPPPEELGARRAEELDALERDFPAGPSEQLEMGGAS